MNLNRWNQLDAECGSAKSRAVCATILALLMAIAVGASFAIIAQQIAGFHAAKDIVREEDIPKVALQSWKSLAVPALSMFVGMACVIYACVQWCRYYGLLAEKRVLAALAEAPTDTPPATESPAESPPANE